MSATDTADLIPVAIDEEMKKSYLDYAMSVIVSRATPDARDGLMLLCAVVPFYYFRKKGWM